MSRAFYAALSPDRQRAFRSAVAETRDGRAPEALLQAWAALDIGADVIDRRVTVVLYETVADRLALVPDAERAPIEAALFGGPAA